jgi:hypothetical protein
LNELPYAAGLLYVSSYELLRVKGEATMLKRLTVVLVLWAGAAYADRSCGQFELLPGGRWQIKNTCDHPLRISWWDKGRCKDRCSELISPRGVTAIPAPEGQYTWNEERAN